MNRRAVSSTVLSYLLDQWSGLHPRRVARALLAITVCLILLSVAAQLSVHFIGEYRLLLVLRRMFSVDRELNIPTLYSSLLLLAAGALLSLIARAKAHTPFRRHWWILAGIFLFLSLDEALTIHEQLTPLVRSIYQTQGLFYWPWVVPYGFAGLVLLIAYAKFLGHLPARTRLLFVVAGTIHVTGALGVEMFEAQRYESLNEQRDAIFYALATVEEFLEMTGVVLFVYALLDYVDKGLASLTPLPRSCHDSASSPPA